MTKKIITGCTGILGEALVKRFLAEAGDDIYLVGRARTGHSFKDRVAEIFGNYLDKRVRAFEGSILGDNFGISSTDLRELDYIDEVWHLVASTDLSADWEKARSINLVATQKAIDFAKSRSSKLFYVSTAYVAGRREGVAKEE